MTEGEAPVTTEDRSTTARESVRVLGYASNGAADEVALEMLARVVSDLPIALEVVNARLQASEFVALVIERRAAVVCFADLPPSPSSKTRYLVRRLHAALPAVHIIVGRWAPPMLADESAETLRHAGAHTVTSTLADTRSHLVRLLEGLVPVPGSPPAADR